jgi:diguanylate cyclase (GGDEF)-like protein
MRSELTIYLLEDNSDDVYLFKKLLENDKAIKYSTLETDSLAELNKMIDSLVPDVLVIDLNISESLGLETLVSVRKFSVDIPIIVLTGNDDELGIKAIQLGAQDYLLKTEITPSSLKRAIQFARERLILYTALSQLATRDKLTMLHNRAAFDERLDSIESDFLRYQVKYAILMIDINHFKPINDSYGHLVGDKILQHIAHRLQMFNRACDFVGRFGGDEFVLIVPKLDCKEKLQGFIDNKRKVLNDQYAIQTISDEVVNIPITVSIGGAIRGLDGFCPKELISIADKNMYKDKPSS